jgi:hypothetical protein
MTERKYIGSGRLLDPCYHGFNTCLNLSILGVTALSDLCLLGSLPCYNFRVFFSFQNLKNTKLKTLTRQFLISIPYFNYIQDKLPSSLEVHMIFFHQ